MLNLLDKDILNFALENGIIDISTIREQIEMSKREEYLKMHPYKIWQGTNGKWYTYLQDKEGRRIQKNRTTQKDIEDLIVSTIRESIESPTVKDIYYDWMDDRLEREEIEKSTYSRYERVFNRCFSEIKNKEIKKIDEMDIENFLKNAIHKNNLSQKAYSNMRTIVYGIFRYAKKRKLVDYSIKQTIGDIQFSRKEFRQVVHEDNEQVFMVSEEEKIIEYLENNKDLVNLGLLLLFKTGLRIGELSVLEKSDIGLNRISINKTETIYKENGKFVYDIKNCPKTEAGVRSVVVPNNCVWILQDIRKRCPFGQYVFMEHGERVKSHRFRNRLRHICKKIGITSKSPHKIRKTYGSKLYDSKDVTEAFIITQMGHTDISCLKKHYYYNRMEVDEQTEMLNKAAIF